MIRQIHLRLAAGIVLVLTIAALAYTGTVSTDAALAAIVGVAAALGLYERGLRTSDS